ncbi:serine phosphatase RsbU (regulator of sigma subunit) [Sedimentibacter acidaminivorans]|jgi:serine phosphatase RsbU (regulator of sigma subunit)|uniref:Serine phosphatase RsbU (Regulator of sigma subunit) n=1 Tax=Sedimentibacter acidaminivorans TaxID=913099 RepID=A0ABS4G971_9FIRM|nr:PP2C family protein-serine/threonine phosphatase [Sedimentibacter acidaminivorans]MBP1924219.1 serine phosphatase RsbU (regulator of sigma subunit) [Sedimentibacter acidaminivorans]
MLDRANEKKYDLNFISLSLKNGFEHIKNNWLVLLVCFFISRYTIIGEIFPFSIIVLSLYYYINGPSVVALLVSEFSVLSVEFSFVYTVMLIAIYLFFYNFRNDEKKPIVIISAYSAIVLFSSKTSILIVDGFNVTGVLLNVFEALFIFSSIILVNEGINIIEKVKLNRKKENIHSFKEHESKKNIINKEIKAVAAATASDTVTKRYRRVSRTKSSDQKLLNIFTDKAKDKIKEQLLWENINVKYLEIISGNKGSIFLSVTIKSEKTPEQSEESIIFAVRNICGVRVKCTEKITASQNYYVLKFKNVNRVKIKTYVAKATKDGSPMSGDSYYYAGKSDKYYTVLCDGIGSGVDAFNESNGTVGMLSRFLYTDFTEEQTIKTLNSLLMLKFDDERYVTFDLHIIDYGLKEIRLYKAGSSPSFILSGGVLEKVESKSLPMGILDNFEYNMFKRTIRKGDIIIMISDGIIDSINLDNKKSLERYLETLREKDPQMIANSILSFALRGQNTIIDDMTVLVTKIG